MPDNDFQFRNVNARRLGDVFNDDGLHINPFAAAPPAVDPVVARVAAADWNNFEEVVKRAEAKPKRGPAAAPKKQDVDLSGTTIRGIATPNFNLPYDSADEAQLRLRGTYISFAGKPVYVHGVVPVTATRYNILVYDHDEQLHTIDGKDPGLSCRSFAPGYIDLTVDGFANKVCGYLCRLPARVYRQGMNQENSIIIDVTNGYNYSIADINRSTFMKMFAPRKNPTPYSVEIYEDLRAAAIANGVGASRMLSTNFAVGVRDKGYAAILYRNSPVADILKKGEVVIKPRAASLFKEEFQRLALV